MIAIMASCLGRTCASEILGIYALAPFSIIIMSFSEP
jgi:hypothetical protein